MVTTVNSTYQALTWIGCCMSFSGCCNRWPNAVTKLYLTLFRHHGLLPSRLLCPWDFPGKNTGGGSISFSRGSSQSRDQTHVSCFGRWSLYQWITWEALSWFTHFLWWKLLQQLPKNRCMEKDFFWDPICLNYFSVHLPTWNNSLYKYRIPGLPW